jgi:multiple sugar transport system permease protein
MDKLRKTSSTIISYFVLTCYAILSMYPFLWMISSSLKSNQEVLTNRSLIPIVPRFDIIVNTWNQLG